MPDNKAKKSVPPFKTAWSKLLDEKPVLSGKFVVPKNKNLREQDLRDAKLLGINFAKCDFTGSNLAHADLTDANLSGAILDGVYADGAVFKNANLNDVKMFEGSLDKVDFSGAKCERFTASAMTAISANFARANLKNAKMTQMGLSIVNFTKADLTNASLAKSELHYTKFDDCNLSGTDLSDTELYHADLSKAKIEGTIFTGAKYDTKTKWPGVPPKEATLVKNVRL